jgi:hypothetical protein
MSLINDALRRASQQKPASAPPSHGGAPLQPVDYRGNPSPWRSLLLIPVLIILCGLSGWFFWSARKTTPTGPALKDALVSQAPPVLTPATQPSDRLIANAPEKNTRAIQGTPTSWFARTSLSAPLPAHWRLHPRRPRRRFSLELYLKWLQPKKGSRARSMLEPREAPRLFKN